MSEAGQARQLRGRPDTRDRLLTAVDELLAERGWNACTLQAVARRAGLTTGAVYSTFGSRGALLAAAMVRRSGSHATLAVEERDLRRAVAAYARSYWASTEDAEGAQLLTAQLDLIRLATTDPALAEALKEGYDLLLERLVADLDARGAALPGVTTTDLARRLVGVLQGLTIQKMAFGAATDEQAFVDAALATVGLPREDAGRRGRRGTASGDGAAHRSA